jgi:hypothetical protein
MTADYIVADVFDALASLPDDSVDLVFTSPPFLALRSYLPADHPHKGKEIGSEPTPAAFIDTLLDVTEELARVLAPHGSLCVELGDTYSGAGGDYGPDGMRGGQEKFKGSALADRKNKVLRADGNRLQQGPAWPPDKSLCLIPESYRWALAYGRNPFNGRETEPWRVRNVVRWHRPNPPVGALGDKFRPSTSDVAVACKSRTRYFDLDAVREARDYTGVPLAPMGLRGRLGPDGKNDPRYTAGHPAGAPPLDTWVIPTEPYKGSHYATFPSDLVVKPVAAMCPERVCVVCGAPSRRIVDVEYEPHGNGRVDEAKGGSRGRADAMVTTQREQNAQAMANGRATRVVTESRWTDCGHDSWRRGTVLDPFAGSGTTLAVATGHGRDAIGIDIDEQNAELARERIGGLFFRQCALTI